MTLRETFQSAFITAPSIRSIKVSRENKLISPPSASKDLPTLEGWLAFAAMRHLSLFDPIFGKPVS